MQASPRSSRIRGYDTQVHRDGAVVYSSEDKPVLLDRGVFIEVADVSAEKGKNLAMALHITGQKSGDKVKVRGDKGFVQGTLSIIPHFNASSGKTVPLTHSAQRIAAGYDANTRQDARDSSQANTARPNVPPRPR